MRGEAETARELADAFAVGDGYDETDPSRSLTHGLHAYPARMHPAIARRVVRAFSAPGERVVDPFCGSGTTLVEAMIHGRRSAGGDLNPLALRITTAKTERLDAARRDAFLAALDGLAERSEERVRARKFANAPIPREEVQWYEPHTLKELAGLHAEIEALSDATLRPLFELLLSALVVKFQPAAIGDGSERERSPDPEGPAHRVLPSAGSRMDRPLGGARGCDPRPRS